jgi:hypothetical protein
MKSTLFRATSSSRLPTSAQRYAPANINLWHGARDPSGAMHADGLAKQLFHNSSSDDDDKVDTGSAGEQAARSLRETLSSVRHKILRLSLAIHHAAAVAVERGWAAAAMPMMEKSVKTLQDRPRSRRDEPDGAVSARLLRSIARFARSPYIWGQDASRRQLPLPAAPLRAAAVARTLRGRGRR